MTTSTNLPTPDALAAAFVAALRADVPNDELLETDAANAADADALVDYVHDLCDANVAMAEAFESLAGVEPDPAVSSHVALWNAAWALAKSRGYGVR